MAKQTRWIFYLLLWDSKEHKPYAKRIGQSSSTWPLRRFYVLAHRHLERPQVVKDRTLIGGYYSGTNGDCLLCVPPEIDPLTI